MPFEESTNVLFLVEYRQAVPKGKCSDALLEPTDIVPTLLSLAAEQKFLRNIYIRNYVRTV